MNPTTRQEAEAYRYGAWAGRPQGHRYDPERCAASVWTNGGGMIESQCSRKPGHGPEEMFCSQHAKAIERDNARRVTMTSSRPLPNVFEDDIPVLVPSSTDVVKLQGIISKLADGIEKWGREEDSIHPDIWDDYVDACTEICRVSEWQLNPSAGGTPRRSLGRGG